MYDVIIIIMFKLLFSLLFVVGFYKDSVISCYGDVIIYMFLISLIFLIFIMLSVSFFSLLERKKLASIQNRKGPNNVGVIGVLQPFSDGIKLVSKGVVIPLKADGFLFVCMSFLGFVLGVVSISFIPFNYRSVICDVNLGVFFVLLFSIFHVYSIMLAGWSSKSSYSFLASLRSSAQLIAYDISVSLILLNLVLNVRSLNFLKLVEYQHYNGWFLFFYFHLFLLFVVCSLAETNRHPFDLVEAESELVSGYNVEYSSMYFGLLFLGEYSSVLFMSLFIVILFFGGYSSFFVFFFY